jgi:hypothetical protein
MTGTFQSTLSVLPLSREEAGTYKIVIWAKDSEGNSTGSRQPRFELYPSDEMVFGTVDFRGPETDTTPPSVSIISISPQSVNRGETVTIRWSASDTTGIRNSPTSNKGWDWGVRARFMSVFDGGGAWLFWESSYSDTILISGDSQNGVFEKTVTPTETRSPGEYELSIVATDWFGNSSSASLLGEFIGTYHWLSDPTYGTLTLLE